MIQQIKPNKESKQESDTKGHTVCVCVCVQPLENADDCCPPFLFVAHFDVSTPFVFYMARHVSSFVSFHFIPFRKATSFFLFTSKKSTHKALCLLVFCLLLSNCSFVLLFCTKYTVDDGKVSWSDCSTGSRLPRFSPPIYKRFKRLVLRLVCTG